MANIAQQYAGAMPQPSGGPTFAEVMPFYKAWGKLEPFARQSAASLVNPEAMRQYQSAHSDYMTGMAGSGAGRFGKSWGGVGALQAEAERQRQAQLQDYSNLFRQGYQDIHYNPTEAAWTRAMTQGTLNRKQRQQMKKIPTWQQFSKKYGAGGGQVGTLAGQEGLISPFLGRGYGTQKPSPNTMSPVRGAVPGYYT